jgi:hypothetical protein
VGVGGEGEDDSSDIERERDGSQQVRLAGFAAGDVVLACEVSLRFRPVLAAVSSDSPYSVTVLRSGLRFFGLCERFLVVVVEKSLQSTAATKPRALNKRALVARKTRRRLILHSRNALSNVKTDHAKRAYSISTLTALVCNSRLW